MSSLEMQGKKSILDSVQIFWKHQLSLWHLDNSEKLHLVCDILRSMHLTDIPVIIKVDRFIEKEELQKEFPQYQDSCGY